MEGGAGCRDCREAVRTVRVMTRAAIAVVGSINMDVAVRVAALPRPGETVPGADAVLSMGGKGANQAVAAARLGADVLLIGCLGADTFGEAARQALMAEKVDLAGVQVIPSAATGVALIMIGRDGQNMISVSPGANAALSTAAILSHETALRASKVLLLQNETPVEAAHAAIQVARTAGALVICDPAPAAGYDPVLIAAADIITPNETEAAMLTGLAVTDRASALAAARLLVELGARSAIVKLGADGVVHAGFHGEGHLAAPPVVAVDTVAAGDCFNGALAVALAEGMAFRDALAFACRAAAIAVTRAGASASMPYRHELN
jgi:ribokinase